MPNSIPHARPAVQADPFGELSEADRVELAAWLDSMDAGRVGELEGLADRERENDQRFGNDHEAANGDDHE
jgi:hypothetical protein